MADNFLERRMEEMKRGKLLGRRHSYSAGKRVLVLCGDPDMTGKLVKRLRGEGWSVAFAGTDPDFGRSLSQASGSQFHPIDICDFSDLERSLRLLWRVWRGVDLILMSVPDGWGEEDYRERVDSAVAKVRSAQPVVCDAVTSLEIVSSYDE